MGRVGTILVTTLLLACTSTQDTSLQVRPIPTPVIVPLLTPLTPAELLSRGLEAFILHQYQDAIQAFQEAIKSGGLNDKGRAVSYWHIGTSYRMLEEQDNAAEAFFYFIAVAQEITDIDDEGFISAIDLGPKIEDANEFIETLWRLKTQGINQVSLF